MKTKIKIPIPARMEERDDKIICDICKKEKSAYNRTWKNKSGFDIDDVEIEMNIGSNYPEGSYGEKTIYDICPECFQNKLMPFLDSLGAKPRVEEYDY